MVGGATWSRIARILKIASTAPAAPSKWPVMDLVDLTASVCACSAKNDKEGVIFAKSVITSSLVKTAMFGADANWGRILCALGNAGLDFDHEKINVTFKSKSGSVLVCQNGSSINFDEDIAKKVLLEPEITIYITMGSSDSIVTAWGCDLTYEYVKINGDYRS